MNPAFRRPPVETIFEQIKILRNGSGVLRLHTVGTKMNRTQTNADHACNVALICYMIDRDCSKNVLLECLIHDHHEYDFGDMAAQGKWRFPELSEIEKKIRSIWAEQFDFDIALTEEERRLVQICDFLELMFFCDEEMRMGNSYAYTVFDRVWCKVRKRGLHLENLNATKLFHALVNSNEIFRSHNGIASEL
jgi:5'-deoxynucleotidase YfbR-like HD superfamily hydrolase